MKYLATQNMTLIEALILLAPDSSMTTLRSWIKEGRVLVDDVPTKQAKAIVQQGQLITLSARRRFAPGNISILYEDHHIVVVDKPEGMLSVASLFEKGETVHAFLKGKYRPKTVYPVHRLDQDTSGVMLFALSEKAREVLKDIFARHAIDRIYAAIVEGNVQPKSGTWTSYQFEDANYYVHNTTDSEKGKMSITHYEVKGNAKNYTLLELKLETGRKNQIRAHCQMAGHSVVGDKKYGSQKDPVKRLCLHAQYLAFQHPITGKKMEFSSPLPEIFGKVIKPLNSNLT